MKRIASIIPFVFCLLTINHSFSRLLNLMITVDESETTDEAMTSRLELALCQKSSIIISHGHLIYNVLTRKATGEGLEFNLEDWEVYKTAQDHTFYVLIPKSYKAEINKHDTKKFNEMVQRSNSAFAPWEILLGLKLETKTVLVKTDISQIEDLEDLKNFKNNWYDTLLDLFIQTKDDLLPLWNLILDGHGAYPDIDFNLTNNGILNKLDANDTYIAGFELSKFREFLQFLIDKINVNFLFYSTCYGGDLNSVLPYVTTLVDQKIGLQELKEYQSGKTISTKETIISLKRPSFIVANGALTSRLVYSFFEHSKKCWDARYYSYSEFFSLLKKYSNSEGIKPTIFKNNELKEILKAITPTLKASDDPLGISGLPSVLFPQTDNFVAVPTNENIAIISNVLAKKHQLEKSSINIVNKEAILIYPNEISAKIDITKNETDKYPSIISMVPGLSLHKIDNITVNSSFNIKKAQANFLDIVFELFSNYIPISPKFFYIKQFNQKNSKDNSVVTYYDVLVGIKKDTLDYFYVIDDKKTIFHDTKKLTASREQYVDDEFLNAFGNYYFHDTKSFTDSVFTALEKLIPKDVVESLTNAHNQIISKEKEEAKTPPLPNIPPPPLPIQKKDTPPPLPNIPPPPLPSTPPPSLPTPKIETPPELPSLPPPPLPSTKAHL